MALKFAKALDSESAPFSTSPDKVFERIIKNGVSYRFVIDMQTLRD